MVFTRNTHQNHFDVVVGEWFYHFVLESRSDGRKERNLKTSIPLSEAIAKGYLTEEDASRIANKFLPRDYWLPW